MEKFETLTSIPTPFPQDNVDTDIIIPAPYLKTIKRTGLGVHAFESVRYDDQGQLTGEAVFDREPYVGSSNILVAGDNFGCGSSREHAPWAITDMGYRCIIAPSFADIFASNCVKNGILTISVPQEVVDYLVADGENGLAVTIDLPNQTIQASNGKTFSFDFNPVHKTMLMNGLDEIGQTLESADLISAFEAKQKLAQPWLYNRDA